MYYRPLANLLGLRGTLSGIGIDALFIDGMDQTIVSVSQLCATGHVCIFTAKEVRTYKAADVLPHLSEINVDRR